jgi:hypothetical protein
LQLRDLAAAVVESFLQLVATQAELVSLPVRKGKEALGVGGR